MLFIVWLPWFEHNWTICFSIKFELSPYLCTCRALKIMFKIFYFYFCINISVLLSVYDTNLRIEKFLNYMGKICNQNSDSSKIFQNLFFSVFKTHKFPSKNVLPKALPNWQVWCKLITVRMGCPGFQAAGMIKGFFWFEFLMPGFLG